MILNYFSSSLRGGGQARRPNNLPQAGVRVHSSLFRQGFTLVELLVVITIIGILIALLLPAVQAARESARRTQCTNNLKQLALGMIHHEYETGRFPTGGWGYWWVGDPDRGTGGDQPGGWLYNILPYIEQTTLYQLGSDNAPDTWTAAQLAGSAKRLQTPLTVANCPTRRQPILYPRFVNQTYAPYGSDPVSLLARSDYAANTGNACANMAGPTNFPPQKSWFTDPNNKLNPPATGISYMISQVKTADVSDGLSNTYMLGEKYLDPDCYFNGSDDSDSESMYCGYNDDLFRATYYSTTGELDPTKNLIYYPPMQDRPGLFQQSYLFGSAHSTSVNMAFCDGSVTPINYSIDPVIHSRLGNRMDGKAVNGSKF